jgi:hypothetical protein
LSCNAYLAAAVGRLQKPKIHRIGGDKMLINAGSGALCTAEASREDFGIKILVD